MRKILFFSLITLSVQFAFGQRAVNSLKRADWTPIKALKVKADRENRLKNMSCVDTVRYPLLKEQLLTDSAAPQFYSFGVWNADNEAFSQTFTHSGTGLTINRVEFLGANLYAPAAGATPQLGLPSITVRARIFNVDASNNPTTLITGATGTTVVTSTAPGFYYITLGTPATPSSNYAIVIDVTGTGMNAGGILDLFTSDAFSGQPQDENLSRYRSDYYPNSVGSWVSIPTLTTGDATNFPADGTAPDPAYDFEPIVAPIVSYNITSTATVTPDPVCLGAQQTFTGSATPTNILTNRMYNYNVFVQYFLGAASDSTYVWDTGDPSPFIWTTNPSTVNYTFPASGSYTSAYIVLGGLWNSCLDFAEDPIVINEPSTAPNSITGTAAICSGGTTTLTATGGTAGTGVTYEWGTGSVVGSNVIAGATSASYTTPALTSTTTYWVRRKDPAPCNTTTGGTTVTVTVDQPSTAPTGITGPSSVCIGSTATLTATGGTDGTGVSYEWGTGAVVGSNIIAGATTATITTPAISANTTFWVRRKDNAPCNTVTAGTTIAISVNALPAITANAANPTICQTGSTNLTASGGTSYTWSTTASTATITVSPTSTTTYTVTGTDVNSCTNTTSVTVTVTPAQDASFSYGTSTVCASGSNITPTSITTPGGTFTSTSGLVFANSSTGEINVAGSTQGNYTITYTTSGTCPGTATATINLTSTPVSGFTYPAGTYCAGGTGTVTPTFNTGASAGVFSSSSPNLNFNTATGVVNLQTSLAGTYTVTNTISATGCATSASTATIVIGSGGTPTIATVSPLCSTSPSVTLVATPTGGTFSGTGVTGSTFNPASGSSVVTYTITDVTSGCVGSNTLSITVTTTPTPQFGAVSSPLCSSAGAVTLNATPSGGTYSGTGVSGNSFNPAQATTGSNSISYTVTQNGCTGTTTTAIVVNTPPAPSISPVGSVCNNTSDVTLQATPAGGTFSGIGVTGNTFSINQAPGNYNVYYTFTDGNGCTGNAGTQITILAAPTASLSAFNPVCLQDGAFTLAGGAPSGGVYSGTGISGGSFNPSVAGVGTFTIDYTYTAANGCSDNATNTISVNDCAGIEDMDAVIVTIAPNPASGEFKIITESINGTSFVIMSEDGKIVSELQDITANETVVNTSTFASGVYFIQFFANQGTTVKKLIVRK